MNQREFLVPIVECSAGATCGSTQFIQDMTVTGFATVTIDSFHYSNGQTRNCTGNGGSPDAINYHAVIRTAGGSGSGGSNGGTLIVTLVE